MVAPGPCEPWVTRRWASSGFPGGVMRTHPEAAQAYSELKQDLARKNPDSMPAYMDGKQDFIQDMEKCALEWARKKVAAPMSKTGGADDHR
jgi:hypothetical protein